MASRREKERLKVIEADPLMSIDSPTVMFFVTDLSGIIIGGGGSGGTVGTTETPPPTGGGHEVPVQRFLAVCPRQDHTAGEDGVDADGRWAGHVQDRYEDARAEADGHGHDEVFVGLHVGGLIIGPATVH